MGDLVQFPWSGIVAAATAYLVLQSPFLVCFVTETKDDKHDIMFWRIYQKNANRVKLPARL